MNNAADLASQRREDGAALFDLSTAAQALGGQARGAASIASVFSDSRAIEPGGLFVALRGARFDGHDYVTAALADGAAAALVEARWAAAHPELEPLLIVEDTLQALGRLAAYWRARFALPVIGVVGSNGKTTVKEMIASILRAAYGEAMLATRGNLNNAIGLPMTLMRLRAHQRAAVIELGMNHPGETAQLSALLQPTIALINNAQREHQEFMHSVAAVAAEHAALIAALPDNGIAIIPASDAHAPLWRRIAGQRRIIDFGLDSPNAPVRASDIQLRPEGAVFSLLTFAGETPLHLHVLGRHNIANALAAAAAALAANLPLAAIRTGLEAFRPVAGRLQPRPARGGGMLIDDTYNANPDSLRAAIDVLAELPGRRLLVLGEMAEVGQAGADFQAEIGAYARERGLDGLHALGDQAAHAVAAFGPMAVHHPRIEALLGAVQTELTPGCTALVKGSRFMRMERVVEALAAAREIDHHAA